MHKFVRNLMRALYAVAMANVQRMANQQFVVVRKGSLELHAPKVALKTRTESFAMAMASAHSKTILLSASVTSVFLGRIVKLEFAPQKTHCLMPRLLDACARLDSPVVVRRN